MRVGILEAGDLAPALEAIDGRYSDMFGRLLRQRTPPPDVAVWRVFEGEFPSSPDECDLWLVTGSRFGVYEDPPWMRRLADFLRTAHAGAAPILAVCFGHQILAHALGGRVEKSDKGWGCGALNYEATNTAAPISPALKATWRIHAIHQDQVVDAPPSGRVWLRSDFCPIAGLAFGPEGTPTALSIQPHPEFGAEFLKALILSRRGFQIAEDVADAALASIEDAQGVEGAKLFETLVTPLEIRAQQRATKRL